tara:strand:+ start:33044 stop:33376 length:333 start_codon:yes stop_codon:yes gene_type:complete
MTKLGKVGKMIPAFPLVGFALSNLLVNPQRFVFEGTINPYTGLLALATLMTLDDARSVKKEQFFKYSRSLKPLEELALWATAFSVLRNESPEVYQTFSGTSFDQAYGRQR